MVVFGSMLMLMLAGQMPGLSVGGQAVAAGAVIVGVAATTNDGPRDPVIEEPLRPLEPIESMGRVTPGGCGAAGMNLPVMVMLTWAGMRLVSAGRTRRWRERRRGPVR